MNPQPIWIPGKPAALATPGEKLWKEQIQHHAASRQGSKHLMLQFVLPEEEADMRTKGLDLYVEPVLSTLIQKLGWMDAKRQQLLSWRASVKAGEPYGLKAWVDDKKAVEPLDSRYGEPAFDFLFEGTFPQKATDPYISELLKKLPWNVPDIGDSRFALRLRFGGSKINIGEVSAGAVKAIVASLFPLIGGGAARPEDWRIEELEVEKNASGIKENTVRISLWQRTTSKL